MSRIEGRFWPGQYSKIPRKKKKSLKKWRFGFYYSNNFHGIYKYEKKCEKIIRTMTIVVRRGHFIWAYDQIHKDYWKILHVYK